jgi:hypothetical protein
MPFTLPKSHCNTGLAACLIVVGLIGCSPSSTTSAQADGQSASDAPAAVAALLPGQPIQIGDLAVVVQPAELKHQVGLEIAPQTAADGGVLVLIRYSVANTSNKPVSAGTFPQIKLLDDKGTEYAPDAGKTGAYALVARLDSKIFSDLNPGITVKNAVVFEVSKASFDSKTWMAVVDGKRVALR